MFLNQTCNHQQIYFLSDGRGWYDDYYQETISLYSSKEKVIEVLHKEINSLESPEVTVYCLDNPECDKSAKLEIDWIDFYHPDWKVGKFVKVINFDAKAGRVRRSMYLHTYEILDIRFEWNRQSIEVRIQKEGENPLWFKQRQVQLVNEPENN